MDKKYTIFFNAFLSGADIVCGVLSLFDGNYIMGAMLVVLGFGLGYLAWGDLRG